MSSNSSIVDQCASGDKASIARLISWAENRDPRFSAALRELYPRIGKAWRVGVTGPPGAGKSTLVNELAKHERTKRRKVAILAVDPSSPFTGGALLGDRIRMEDRTSDEGVFIRSMATRGSHGGLARAAVDACDVMDAAGFDQILVETVGVGQAEYDVVAATDTVLVVLCPGAGDGIQAMKAGILEVADVLVVNKSDLPGADRLITDLDEAVHIRATNRAARAHSSRASLAHTDRALPARADRTPPTPDAEGKGEEWTPRVVACSAAKGEGIDDVSAAIDDHRAFLERGALASRRRDRRLAHVRRLVDERMAEELWGRAGWSERAQVLLDSGRTPYDVVESLLGSILSPGSTSDARREAKRP